MYYIFWMGLAAGLGLVLMLVWSILTPEKRLWPVGRLTLFNQFWIWGLVVTLFVSLIGIGISDWNHFGWPLGLRYGLGGTLFVLSHFVVYSEAFGIGLAATSGARGRLKTDGFYRYSRNPQYVGDMVMVIGWMLLSASLFVLPLAALSLIVLLLAPLAEESWMEETYGQAYLDYKAKVRRYL